MPSQPNKIEVNNQISFFASRTNSAQHSIVVHVIWIGQIFIGAFDTRIQRSKQLEEYVPGQKRYSLRISFAM